MVSLFLGDEERDLTGEGEEAGEAGEGAEALPLLGALALATALPPFLAPIFGAFFAGDLFGLFEGLFDGLLFCGLKGVVVGVAVNASPISSSPTEATGSTTSADLEDALAAVVVRFPRVVAPLGFAALVLGDFCFGGLFTPLPFGLLFGLFGLALSCLSLVFVFFANTSVAELLLPAFGFALSLRAIISNITDVNPIHFYIILIKTVVYN